MKRMHGREQPLTSAHQVEAGMLGDRTAGAVFVAQERRQVTRFDPAIEQRGTQKAASEIRRPGVAQSRQLSLNPGNADIPGLCRLVQNEQGTDFRGVEPGLCIQ